MGTVYTIQTQDGNVLKGQLLKQSTILQEEKTYLLSDYNMEKYGDASFIENSMSCGGGFRRARSLMPFEFLDKTGKDINWGLYESDDAQIIHKIANAFVVNFLKFKTEGKGLYIYSGTKGSGKTMLSCCLVNEVIKKHDVSVKFISILDFLDLTKKGYTSIADREEVDSLRRACILVLDDIGVEVSKDWVNTTLYQLINYRYSSKLITIFKSNIPIENLKIDDRIKDRINAMTIKIHLPEVSIRWKQAEERNAEFISTVL